MDTRTGRIVRLTEEQNKALRSRIERGETTRLVPIPAELLSRVQAMHTAQRKRWARGQRRSLRELYAKHPRPQPER